MASRESPMAGGGDRVYTLAEFRALPEEDDYRLELADGWLVREPRPGALHGMVVARLARILLEYADTAGGAVIADAGFILEAAEEGRETVRGPDLAYVRDAPPPYDSPEGFLRGAPDLAVEVVSPGNSAGEIHRKVLEYLDSGAQQVWVVYPRTLTVAVHWSGAEARLVRVGERIEAGEELPGLDVRVGDLFGV